MISTKSSRTNVGSKCLSRSALITVGDLEVSITFWIDVLASSCSIGHLDSTNLSPPVGADSGPNVGVRVDAYGLNWSRGVEGAVARGRPQLCGPQPAAPVCLAGYARSYFVGSCAFVDQACRRVDECHSLVDQDHPGDLWPGFCTSVFFGVTPAAGPGVVVAVISRAADHCVTGFRRQDEPFGRLNPEHLVGMLG
jgi:hypothetical protein